MKAPPYFKEIHQEIDQMEKTMAGMLGVAAHWLREQEGKDAKQFSNAVNEFAKQQGWKEEETKKFNALLDIRERFMSYCWGRFTWEHLDSEWGKSDFVEYDEEKDELVMYWFRPRAKKAAQAIRKQLYLVKGGSVQKHNV